MNATPPAPSRKPVELLPATDKLRAFVYLEPRRFVTIVYSTNYRPEQDCKEPIILRYGAVIFRPDSADGKLPGGFYKRSGHLRRLHRESASNRYRIAPQTAIIDPAKFVLGQVQFHTWFKAQVRRLLFCQRGCWGERLVRGKQNKTSCGSPGSPNNDVQLAQVLVVDC